MISTRILSAARKLAGQTGKRRVYFSRAVIAAEKASGAAMVKTARSLSRGTMTAKTRRQLGSPYRIGGVPPMDPAIINRIKGDFERKWAFSVTFRGTEMHLTVFNSSDHSKFMYGTTKMIARPILEAMILLERDARTKRLIAAAQAANRKP